MRLLADEITHRGESSREALVHQYRIESVVFGWPATCEQPYADRTADSPGETYSMAATVPFSGPPRPISIRVLKVVA